MLLVVLLTSVACADELELPVDAAPELREGLEVYRQRCAQCHGPTGGGGIGSSLRDIEQRSSVEELRMVVAEGRNSMPRFGDTLSDAEIDAVIRLMREGL